MTLQTMNEEPPIMKSNKPRKFLLHSFLATGHVLPMQAVARALIDRGHEVVWLTGATQESRVRASGATFVATEEVAVIDAALLAAQPDDLTGAVNALFGGRVIAQVADIRRVLADFSADCLLNDALPQGAAALYELGEVPFYATLGVIPMYLPRLPSKDGQDTAHEHSEHLSTSMLGTILSKPQTVLPCINLQRACLGLPSLEPSMTLHYSPFLHIQASCEMLEFQDSTWSQKLPPKLHYTGPLVTSAKAPSLRPSWWTDVESASCIIGITQGTYALDPSSLIIPAIKALAEDSNMLLVIPSPYVENIQRSVQAAGIHTGNVRLAEWIPYDLLLPRCTLLITNGGYGSVTQALAQGVPVVCACTTEDKKDTAERVTWVGAGIDLGTDTPSSVQIRDAVHKVLDDSSYRDNAIRVAKQLHGLGGADRACALLEEAVALSISGQHFS